MKSRLNSVNQIFNPHAFLFFLLTGATWYYHAIYIVFTYFASFTGYEDDIFEVISNLHVQGSKFGRKFDKFGGKPFKKLNSAEFMELVFSKSGVGRWTFPNKCRNLSFLLRGPSKWQKKNIKSNNDTQKQDGLVDDRPSTSSQIPTSHCHKLLISGTKYVCAILIKSY